MLSPILEAVVSSANNGMSPLFKRIDKRVLMIS